MSHFHLSVFWVDEVNSYVALPKELEPEALAPMLESEQPDDYEYELPEGCVELDYDEDTSRRMLALMISDGEKRSAPDQERYNDKVFSWGNREFLVVTDDEADKLWDEELDNYLDECVLTELPENVRHYFDREKWKHDARIDGRGHALNRYDGNEDCVEIDGTDYFIYRQN